MSDKEVWDLSRGGHDYRKIYAAYKAAKEHKGQPTVILAKTIKGWTLGSHFEGRNSTHQMKKLTAEDLARLPRPALPGHPRRGAGQDPAALLPARPGLRRDAVHARAAAGPGRRGAAPAPSEFKTLKAPEDKALDVLRRGSGKQEVATTMAFVRLLKELLKDDELGPALRADHPGRGAHLRPGLAVLLAQDLQPGRPAVHLGRPRADAGVQGVRAGRDPARGDQRGRLDRLVHRRRHLVRHARRADDPDLHLLLDVRVPADRRQRSGPPPTR